MERQACCLSTINKHSSWVHNPFSSGRARAEEDGSAGDSIRKPNLIVYNGGMNGVDANNQLGNYYPT